MAQILTFPVKQIVNELTAHGDVTINADTPLDAIQEMKIRTNQLADSVYIKKGFIESFNKEGFIFYKNDKQIGAATSEPFLRFCYADQGAEEAPLVD
jgi:hypothetical protein